MTSETHKRIETRAYQLWEAAGRPDGAAEKYWLEAEAELEGEMHSGGGIPVTDELEAPAGSADPPKRARNGKKK